MADSTSNTPALPLGVTTRTRREAFSALGVTGLAAIAVGGFARPDNLIGADQMSPAGDAALLAACATFADAHAEQGRFNESRVKDDNWAARVVDDWYDAVEGLLAAPDPATPAGRFALAAAGHTVLLDECGGSACRPIEGGTSLEQRVALKALAAAAGAKS